MPIWGTIIPIFIIVLLGWGVHRRGFLPAEFMGPANRLVFYVAIPAMIFQSIAKSTLREWFNPRVIILTLSAALLAYGASWLACRVTRMRRSLSGTFIQSAGHGNLGYFGLAVAYYYLGNAGLVHASVIAGFLMILQNVLSILALQSFSTQSAAVPDARLIGGRVLGNPVILAVLAGMLFSMSALPMPLIVERSLTILSGLALPTALLVIGASLSFQRMKAQGLIVTGATVIKLLVLPGIGWLLFQGLGVQRSEFLPALILLASPTATVSFVMAREMQGDGDLAAAAISASTLASALTYVFWLQMAAW
ncbi:MAG: AEC family transporter [Desulfobacteraceae bacterium]|nr:MAG: AEC family transporter [Desulfobacteraceae bacterium]